MDWNAHTSVADNSIFKVTYCKLFIHTHQVVLRYPCSLSISHICLSRSMDESLAQGRQLWLFSAQPTFSSFNTVGQLIIQPLNENNWLHRTKSSASLSRETGTRKPRKGNSLLLLKCKFSKPSSLMPTQPTWSLKGLMLLISFSYWPSVCSPCMLLLPPCTKSITARQWTQSQPQ